MGYDIGKKSKMAGLWWEGALGDTLTIILLVWCRVIWLCYVIKEKNSNNVDPKDSCGIVWILDPVSVIIGGLVASVLG